MGNKPKPLALDKEAVLIVFMGGAFFGLGSLFHELSLKLFFAGFLFGAFSAFAALPFIDSNKWKSNPEICCLLGLIGAAIVAVVLQQPFQYVILFAVVGAILGYFAPAWAKHI